MAANQPWSKIQTWWTRYLVFLVQLAQLCEDRCSVGATVIMSGIFSRITQVVRQQPINLHLCHGFYPDWVQKGMFWHKFKRNEKGTFEFRNAQLIIMLNNSRILKCGNKSNQLTSLLSLHNSQVYIWPYFTFPSEAITRTHILEWMSQKKTKKTSLP